MSTTKVYSTRRRYALHEIPTKLGYPIDALTFYPLSMGHDSYGFAGWMVLQSLHVDDGILQVVGDPDNGHYEWIWFTTAGTIHHTRSGWGMIARCLQDGLTFAFDCQTGYDAPKPHELA